MVLVVGMVYLVYLDLLVYSLQLLQVRLELVDGLLILTQPRQVPLYSRSQFSWSYGVCVCAEEYRHFVGVNYLNYY